MQVNKLNKKGAGGGMIALIVGLLITTVFVVAFAPTIFGGLGVNGATALGNTTANPNVPVYIPTILLAVVGIALVVGVLKLAGISHK